MGGGNEFDQTKEHITSRLICHPHHPCSLFQNQQVPLLFPFPCQPGGTNLKANPQTILVYNKCVQREKKKIERERETRRKFNKASRTWKKNLLLCLLLLSLSKKQRITETLTLLFQFVSVTCARRIGFPLSVIWIRQMWSESHRRWSTGMASSMRQSRRWQRIFILSLLFLSVVAPLIFLSHRLQLLTPSHGNKQQLTHSPPLLLS